ncbi:hypothetical protein ACFQ1R_11705 [Mariniflexile jejuense]|uniref:Uncharacterized protein n=1 Tax=Mariniflexile jejuense TaxID=1173582 RepID=A0ABW3JJT8_9FLAO
MSLKSEIEQYLLENDFSLSKTYLFDDEFHKGEMLIYIHNKTKSDTVILNTEINEKCVSVDLENNHSGEKYRYASRYIVNTINEFVFLITHSTRSFLCDEKIIF